MWCTICVHVGSLDKLTTACPVINSSLKLKFQRDVAMRSLQLTVIHPYYFVLPAIYQCITVVCKLLLCT